MEFIEALKKAGIRATDSRVKVLELLQEESHLALEDAYQRLRQRGHKISYTTVYRVLSQLTEARLVRRRVLDVGNPVYELEGEGHASHVVCTNCRRVGEIPDAKVRDALAACRPDVIRATGFEPARFELTMYGLCENCRAADKARTPRKTR